MGLPRCLQAISDSTATSSGDRCAVSSGEADDGARHPSNRGSDSMASTRRLSSSTGRDAEAAAREIDGFLRHHGYSYTSTAPSSLDCPICRSPLVDPVLTPCDHIFCSVCLQTALQRTLSCPVCRQGFDAALKLSPAPRLIQQMADDLEVACSHSSIGCTFVGPRHLLKVHLLHDCQLREVGCPCSRQGCGTIIRKRDLAAHLEACSFGLVPCPMSCGAQVRRGELETHLETICPRKEVECPHCATEGLTRETLDEHIGQICDEAPTLCPHARFGCNWHGIRRDLINEHLDPDVNACPFEAIKGFLLLCEARMTASEVENAALKRRVADLERSQKALAIEAVTCRNSLGQFALPRTVPTPDSPQLRPLHDFLVEPADAWHGVGVGTEHETRPARANHEQFESLPSTISRIGSSLQSLEGAIERLDLRHQVGVLDETIRLQEEVGTLRAAVHGLRLQGAWMLMEREREIEERRGTAEGGTATDSMAAAAARRRAFDLPFISPQFERPPPRPFGSGRSDTKL